MAVTLSYAVADSDKVNFKKICVVIERLDKVFFLLPLNVATASYSAVQILHGCRHHMMQATEHTYLEYIGIHHTLQLQGLCAQTATTMCHVYPFYLSAFACNAT